MKFLLIGYLFPFSFPAPSTLSVNVLSLGAQSCPTVCDPMACSLPGSSVQGILQARILEWVTMPSFRGSSQPRDRTQISCMSLVLQADSLLSELPGKSLSLNRTSYICRIICSRKEHLLVTKLLIILLFRFIL